MLALTDAYERMTVRQVYYALDVRGIVAKTEAGYGQVEQQVLRMRREALLALLPWTFREQVEGLAEAWREYSALAYNAVDPLLRRNGERGGVRPSDMTTGR